VFEAEEANTSFELFVDAARSDTLFAKFEGNFFQL
jgi:hypothetical protein